MTLAKSKNVVIVCSKSFEIERHIDAKPEEHPDLFNLPKGLFVFGSRPAIDYIYDLHDDNDIYIITSSANYKYYEHWAFLHDLPLDKILTVHESKNKAVFHDAADLFLRLYEQPKDLVLVSCDYLFPVAVGDKIETCLGVDGHFGYLSVPSHLLRDFSNYLDEFFSQQVQSPEQHLIQHFEPQLHQIPDHPLCKWTDSQLQIREYLNMKHLIAPTMKRAPSMIIQRPRVTHIVNARVGVLGNPSDGFFGQCISALIKNFWVQVTLVPNMNIEDTSISISRSDISDADTFPSLKVCSHTASKNGYYGANRLFQATLNLFYKYCLDKRIETRGTGFKIYFKTNIPRQVGLAGSSALVTGLIKSLVAYYNVTSFPLHEQANMALAAERDELGISAGHQDRVVQAYGGCVYMNFDQHLMHERGYGEYCKIDPDLLPKTMWMAYIRTPEESGKVHHAIKERFQMGDPKVIETMQAIGNCAFLGKKALENRDLETFAELLNQNFDLRRELYGDLVIGRSLEIVLIARSHGHACKLSGSGGCVIGMSLKQDSTRALRKALESHGFVFCHIEFDNEQV
ncbi:ribosomal protein S5 domain 2-type protein [Gorgonomyces haynaldii]|nr:ribosomal protein S5 domain 2-type protein [Gorgonomyces haynaldii]